MNYWKKNVPLLAAAITAAIAAIAGPLSVPLLLAEFKKSGAEKLGKTQDYDLRAQLECGTQFVDIRATGMLECHHGFMTCTNNFEKVMNVSASKKDVLVKTVPICYDSCILFLGIF